MTTKNMRHFLYHISFTEFDIHIQFVGYFLNKCY